MPQPSGHQTAIEDSVDGNYDGSTGVLSKGQNIATADGIKN